MRPPTSILGLLAIAASIPAVAAAEIISAGPGSYTTARPYHCKPLPDKLHRTADVTGPTPTNQWWSSLVWQEFSNNLFAHPLAMVCTPEGLAVTYPGAAIVASAEAIMGGGVPPEGDLRIGLDGGQTFTAALLGGYCDAMVTSVFTAADASLKTRFGHGSPYVFATYDGAAPVIRFSEIPRVWAGGDGGSPAIGVSVKGNHYGLFAPSASTWSGLDGSEFTIHSGDDRFFSIALLPDASAESLARFQRHAHNHVVEARIDTEVLPGKVRATHRFITRPMEGDGTGTLIALYPHQWKYSDTSLTEMTYASVRGVMKVVDGASFTTEVPVQGMLPMLPAEGIRNPERLLGYLNKEAAKEPPPHTDTYWEGKYLGRLATLSGIAEAAGQGELQQQFLAEIKRRLEAWFVANPGAQDTLFYYNTTWGTLIGSRPSYGSDVELNDHHFHYGYFIRAAAEVARIDKAWAEKWRPMVELLIRDIASPDRNDPLFPHMRCFDKFAGHSWASGNANFADGNNQESSSESLNAWYALAMWGEIIGDAAIRDTGIALFNIERTAVEEYWFDVANTNFPESFPQVALGMVWGGKGAFATWFSADIDCIHGINWLPFTPASLYMGRHPQYVKRNFDRIVEKRPKGRDFNNGWGDLVVMFGALHDPKPAAEWLDNNPDCSIEAGNTHAFMDHWIGTLYNLGLNDTGITADHPFTSVLQNNGRKTYLAYNFGGTPLHVRFSDGTTVVAKPNALTKHSENQ